MKFSIWYEGPMNSTKLRRYVESKARCALGVHTHRLSNGEMRLRKEQTAEGPIAHCSLDLKSFTHGTIHVAESGENEFAAISKSLRVAASKLQRTAERRKDNGRRRGRARKRLLNDTVLEFEEAHDQYESTDDHLDLVTG